MRKLVGFVLGLSLIAAAFAGLALVLVMGIVTAIALGVTSLLARPHPQMAYARVKPTSNHTSGHQHPYRVWNDGRGTIIDM